MDKCGYWGGKWNIGYGRLKIIRIKQNNNAKNDWTNNNKFNFSFEDNKNKEFDLNNYLKFVGNFTDLIKIGNNNDKKIKILRDKVQNQDLKEVIKELIKQKAKERSNVKDREKRHKIFSTTKKPPNNEDLLPQWSKILPFIKEENGNYVRGFLSIVDLLKLYE
jgi:CRISPR-associated protein Cmr1